MPTITANIIQDAFGPLIQVFEAILVFIHAHVTHGSWGLAIIGLTIVVRAALVPLTLKQFSSMSKLQALGPELKELQKRYKDDKQRLNEEMMKFYKENEVNPFASCLPLLLQLPVFLSLFYMLRVDLKKHICGAALTAHHITSQSAIANQTCGAIAPGSGKFLFIPDITSKASGVVLGVLIVLYIASQLVSSLLTTATVDKNQRLLMLGIPFVFSIFLARYPAGLIVYWITTNTWTMGQQYIVRRRAGPIVAAGASAAAPAGGRGATRKEAVEAPEEKPAGGGLMARIAATRDAARSAVTGVSGAAAPGAAGPGAGSAGTTRGGGRSRPARATGGEAGPGGRGTKSPASRGAAGTARTAKGAGATPGKTTAGTAKGDGTNKEAAKGGAKPRPAGGAAKSTPKSTPKGSADGAAAKDEAAAAPRARGAVPPPPPRKKKKRSGRRR